MSSMLPPTSRSHRKSLKSSGRSSMEPQRKGLVPISPSQTPRSMEKGGREVRSGESGSSSRHDKDKGVNVQVLLRCRPLNDDELKIGAPVVVSCNESRREVSTIQTISNKQIDRTFIFDKVFGPDSEQKDLYDQAVSPIVYEVLEGYNCTIFAYGQTGTGKTYTMEGGARKKNGEFPSDAGVIPRSVKQIFEILEAQNAEYNMKVTFLELYNEEITDLLASEECYKVVEEKSKKPIALMEDGKGGVFVRGLEEEIVCTANEIYKILEKGSARRRTAETLLNKQSSRSHSIFSITIHIKESTPEGEEMIKCGKLNLVDLAGSENISRSGAREGRAREAGEINKSLLTLGRVINTLVEHSGHIPYRDSKLTRLLRDSLGGKTKTCIIATIAPSIYSLEETLSTLDYAHRAKNIKNKPEINQKMMKTTMIKDLYSEIDKLKQEVHAAREKNGIYIPKDRFLQEEVEKKAMSDRLEHMELELESKDKVLREIQSMHHSQQFLVNELNDKLGRTEIKLEETQQMVAAIEERLLQANSTIKEKEYLISNLLKSEKSLMEQAFELRAELENAASDMSKLFTKIERKDKIEDGNKILIREFESQLHQQLEALHKMVTGSMVEQERRLNEMEDDMRSFVSTKTEAAEDLRTCVEQWKAMYASGINALDDIVEGLEKNSCTIFEDINLEFTQHSSSADNMLRGITSAADLLLGDLQSNLHSQEEKLHAFSLQQNDVHSKSLEMARSISKTAITFFNSLDNQTSKLIQIVEEVEVTHNHKLSELEHKFEECTAREEKQLLEKVAELVAGSNARTKTLVQESIQALRDSMVKGTSQLQSEVTSIEDQTSSMRMKWTGYMYNTEKCNIEEAVSVKKRQDEMEEGLENCLKKAKLCAQQWRDAQESLMDLEKNNISSVESISRRGLKENQGLYSRFASSTSSTMENVENARKVILSRIDESVRRDNDMCGSTETVTKPCCRESHKVRSGHYHGISVIKENAGKCLVGEYKVYEATCSTPRKRPYELPSRAAIEGLATPAFGDLLNHFYYMKQQQQPSSINGDVTSKPSPQQPFKDPRLPLTTIN